VNNRKSLARSALNDALKLRISRHIDFITPIEIFDFATNLGIDVRFVDIPSLEAMYVKGENPRILISSHRPLGRQVFNCTHEIGHHFYNHGSKIDEYIEDDESYKNFSSEEYLADRFASFLLMPKTLVNHAFSVRNWEIATSQARHFYTVAGWLSVGYTALIHQMRNSLNLLSATQYKELLKQSPRSIRREILKQDYSGNLTIVDIHWTKRAVDIEVGDLLLLPTNTIAEGACIAPSLQNVQGCICKAIAPGIGRVYVPDSTWASYVRVSRRGYSGRSIFRHLEDPDYDSEVI
jgi:Zn-dependent peptidase ImmA (M78 family)